MYNIYLANNNIYLQNLLLDKHSYIKIGTWCYDHYNIYYDHLINSYQFNVRFYDSIKLTNSNLLSHVATLFQAFKNLIININI